VVNNIFKSTIILHTISYISIFYLVGEFSECYYIQPAFALRLKYINSYFFIIKIKKIVKGTLNINLIIIIYFVIYLFMGGTIYYFLFLGGIN